MFLWRPLTGDSCIINGTIDDIMYPWFFYVLPDVVPALGMIAMMVPTAPPKTVTMIEAQQSAVGFQRLDGREALLDASTDSDRERP